MSLESENKWVTVSQATYTPFVEVKYTSAASQRRAKEHEDAVDHRAHSPTFVAKSNAEISYSPPPNHHRATRQRHEQQAQVRHVPFETSTSRAAFQPPPSDQLIRPQRNAEHPSTFKTTFTAQSESRRQYVAHRVEALGRKHPHERPLRSTPTVFDAVSTYKSSF